MKLRKSRPLKVSRSSLKGKPGAGIPGAKFALVSIALLLAIRLYMVFFTVHVVSWDDRWYRGHANREAQLISFADAAKRVFLPNPRTLDGERTVGYHSWLVLTAKVFPMEAREHGWQLLNFAFLLLQLVLVFSFSKWATNSDPISAAFAFLYVSSPIVFGINRWIFTENHVMPALLLLSFLSAFVLTRKKDSILLPAASALLFGVFSTLREYAIASWLVLSVGLIAGLIVDGKKKAATTFALVCLPFVEAMALALPPVAKNMLLRSSVMVYFHPLTSWLPHVLVFTVGFAFAFLIVGLSIIMAGELRRTPRMPRLTGLHLIFAAHVVLFLVYCVLIIVSKNRVVRPAVPPMITLFCLLMIGTRLFDLPRLAHWRSFTQRSLKPLMAVSWAFMLYELFISFNGGQDYRVHPFNMEHFNHPMFLRPLQGPEDMHVIPAKPYWEYEYTEDGVREIKR